MPPALTLLLLSFFERQAHNVSAVSGGGTKSTEIGSDLSPGQQLVSIRMPNIPSIIHYVWVGPAQIPAEYRAYIAGWQRVMPDWQIMGWTDKNIDWSSRYLKQAYATRGWTRVADYMRVHALHRFGGFYLDTDVELVRSLDPLRSKHVVLGFQSLERIPSWVNNAVIGAEPGHPFLARWLRAFSNTMYGWRRMGDGHGPGLVTRLLEAEGLDGHRADAPRQVGQITLLPRDRFYPYDWTEPFSQDRLTSKTFAIHHWSGTDAAFRPLTAIEKMRALSALAAPGVAASMMRHRVEAERRIHASIQSDRARVPHAA